MKKILIKFLLPALLLVGMWSCKKEINQVYFVGGTPPVLSASTAGPLVLTSGNANNTAITFTWTNPDYQLSTGISSQDVTYYLEIDTTGANFTNPNKQEASIAKNLNVSYTVKDLNAFLTKLLLVEDKPHNVEFRLRATLLNNSVPLYSNVIKMIITPYLDVVVPLPPTDKLFITGDAVASGWTNTPPVGNPPTGQQATPVASSYTSTGRPTAYTITMNFVPGKQYKFLSTQGFWQPQYGGSNADGGDIGYNMGLPGQSDPAAIPTPSAAGTYKVTLNFKTGKYTVEKQ